MQSKDRALAPAQLLQCPAEKLRAGDRWGPPPPPLLPSAAHQCCHFSHPAALNDGAPHTLLSSDASMEEAEAGPSGRGAGYGGALPRRITRLQSPPCYRNIFVEGDSEEAYASWKAPRPAAQHLTRYRWGGGSRC